MDLDIEKFMRVMSDADTKQRQQYHLTYGDFIKALRAADKDAEIDKRINGISAYRGYYVDIALNTVDNGYSTTDEDYNFDDYDNEKYTEWLKEHTLSADTLPRKAHELADVLESLIGKCFEGYKGGWYQVTADKALWLAEDYGNCSEIAVIGITPDLQLITKEIEI